jgi:2-octaprenyl-6-methoxyphenol hydroxylase
MPERGIDVLIRGAGPVGCTLALALRGSGLEVAVLDVSTARSSFRPIALSYASRLILERAGAWQGLAATPIESIHVSQRGGFGQARLEAADAGVPALGYVTDYSNLAGILRSQVQPLITQDEIAARCVVHAEGSSAQAEEKRYAQDAVVALVTVDPPSRSAAFERFTADGPLALLPLGGRYALVWSTRPENARALVQAPEPQFLAELAAAAGNRPGRPLQAEARMALPLVLRVRATRVAPREVFIGNAAQSLHPAAGQGLNLGLRDAWDLAEAWRAGGDPGDAATLARYAARRRVDAAATIRLTDFLAGAFLGTSRLARGARGAAMAMLDIFPPARRFFARRMIYGPSALP